MSLLALVVFSWIGTSVECDDSDYRRCLVEKESNPRLICMKPECLETRPPVPVQLVMPRSEQARKDVQSTGEHLDDATQRTR